MTWRKSGPDLENKQTFCSFCWYHMIFFFTTVHLILIEGNIQYFQCYSFLETLSRLSTTATKNYVNFYASNIFSKTVRVGHLAVFFVFRSRWVQSDPVPFGQAVIRKADNQPHEDYGVQGVMRILQGIIYRIFNILKTQRFEILVTENNKTHYLRKRW